MGLKCLKIGVLNVGIIPIRMENVSVQFVEMIISIQIWMLKSRLYLRFTNLILLGIVK